MKAESESLLPCVSIKRKGSTGVVATIFTIKRPAGALKGLFAGPLRPRIISTAMRANRCIVL